nr:tetratricopeptide repeat protein [uncultured Anaerotignum sp.]
MAFYIGEMKKVRNSFFEAYRDGEYKKAILLGRHLLQIYAENNDCDCIEYAVDLSNLAQVFDRLQMFEQAEGYYQQAAELKKHCGGESLSYADTLNNLAIVYNQTNRQAEALRLHEKVLGIREAKLGRGHTDVLHSLYHLGNTYELLGEYDRAIGYHTEVLKNNSFSPLDLADVHGALARAYEAKGNYKKAIYYYEVCLDLIEKARGCDTFYYMMTVLTLAAVCEKAGLLDLAVEYCERAVEIRRELMSADHLDFMNSLNSLAALCCKSGQYDKALELHKEVLEIVERMLGKEHIFYADALGNLSVDYGGKKEYKKALALSKKALNRKTELLGEGDPQVAACQMALGTLYEGMGKTEEALQCFTAAAEIRSGLEEGKNTAYADTLTAIGKLYEGQKAYAWAEKYVTRAIEVRRACGDEKSGMYLWCLHLLAEIKRQQGDFETAVGYCRTAAEIAEKRFGETHPSYAAALEKLGLIEEAAGDFAKAELYFYKTAEIRKEMLDEDNPLYLGALESLARVLVKQKKYKRAIELYQEKNDLNFEETPQEQMAAANNLLAIANCYKLSGVEEKAAAYFAEAEAKQRRSGLEMDEIYEKRRAFYLQQGLERTMPPKPMGKDAQKELEYYSAVALSIRSKEGEGPAFAKALLKTAALHAKLGHQRDTETLLDRVLSIGARDGIFTTAYGRLCDRAGRIYAQAGSKSKAEATLRRAYQIQSVTEKCMTVQGHSLLLRLLQEKGDEKAYFAVKNDGKLE